MLELAILGLLKERAMHGYQLRKRLADTLGGFWRVSYGSLYPALKRLQSEAAVEMVFPRENLGRRKNVYRITEKGEALFAELLGQAGQGAGEDVGFPVRLAFFQYLKPETRIALLERRRAFLQTRWSEIKHSLQSYRERLDGYVVTLMDHELATTEHDIKWLDDMIQAERRQTRGSGNAAPKRKPRPTPLGQARVLPQKERA